jgi:hypothetical protein
VSGVCTQCGDALTGRSRLYCSALCKQRAWRQKPENREREREFSRAWKARNRDRNRARDRARAADPDHRGRCEMCGGLMGAGSRQNGICRDCRVQTRTARARQIEAWWAEGISSSEIALRLGWTKGHLYNEMDRLRREGYRLPYRYALRTPRHEIAA